MKKEYIKFLEKFYILIKLINKKNILNNIYY